MYVRTHTEKKDRFWAPVMLRVSSWFCVQEPVLGGPSVLGLTLDVCQTSSLPAGLSLWPCSGPSDCSCLPHTCSSETNETPLGIDLTCDT